MGLHILITGLILECTCHLLLLLSNGREVIPEIKYTALTSLLHGTALLLQFTTRPDHYIRFLSKLKANTEISQFFKNYTFIKNTNQFNNKKQYLN